MPVRDIKNITDKSKIVVSVLKQETAINTPNLLNSTTSRSWRVDTGSLANLTYGRETNADEITGKEEPTRMDVRGDTSTATLNVPKLNASTLAAMLRFHYGTGTDSAEGSGYKHITLPKEGSNMPYLTLGCQYGGIEKVRYASMVGNTLTLTAETGENQDNWINASEELIGTGKFDSNIIEEDVTAAYNATKLTLTGYIEATSSVPPTYRFDSVHKIIVTNPSGYDESVVVDEVGFQWDDAVAGGGNAGDGTVDIEYANVVAGGSNVGNGTVTAITAGTKKVAQTFTLTCITEALDGGIFSVVGSRSGALANATVGTPYTSAYINFTINDSTTDFDLNDNFTITANALAVPETITLTCTAESVDSGTFSVIGSRSGNLGNATVGTLFTSGNINLLINDGTNDFELDDVFTIDPLPSEIYITAPGGTGDSVTYKVTYENAGDPSGWLWEIWTNFDAIPYPDEPPLRVSNFCIKYGGQWDGSAYNGGYSISRAMKSFTLTANNNMMIEFRPGGCVGEIEVDRSYANYIARDGREQTAAIVKEMEDAVFQKAIQSNREFAIEITMTGSEFAVGENYSAYLVFPKCSFSNNQRDGGTNRLSENMDIAILEDSVYSSVYTKVIDTTAIYAG